MKSELDCALLTHALAIAVLVQIEFVNVVRMVGLRGASKRNEAKPVHEKLIMKRRRVLSNFNQVNSHRWHFGNHDSSESICDS